MNTACGNARAVNNNVLIPQSSKSQSDDSAISAGECMAKQARLQRNIALAGVEVASLVGANCE